MMTTQKMLLFVSGALMLSGIVAEDGDVFQPPMSLELLDKVQRNARSRASDPHHGDADARNVRDDEKLVRAMFEEGLLRTPKRGESPVTFQAAGKTWRTECKTNWAKDDKHPDHSWYCMVIPDGGPSYNDAKTGNPTALKNFQAANGGHLSFYYLSMLKGLTTGVHSKLATGLKENGNFDFETKNLWGRKNGPMRDSAFCQNAAMAETDATLQQLRVEHCTVLNHILTNATTRMPWMDNTNRLPQTSPAPTVATGASFLGGPYVSAFDAPKKRDVAMLSAPHNDAPMESTDDRMRRWEREGRYNCEEIDAARAAAAAMPAASETMPLLACTPNDGSIIVGRNYNGEACYKYFSPRGACIAKDRLRVPGVSGFIGCCENFNIGGICYNSADPYDAFGRIVPATKFVDGSPYLYFPNN